MPDSFFASTKTRKRKRSVSTVERGGSAKKISRKGKTSSQDATHAGIRRGGKRAADEELNSDRTDSEGGDIDDIDLRADIEPETSGDEDEQETPAEKRLRLAKLYLETVKGGLGKYHLTELVFLVFSLLYMEVAEGEFDAAEIDRELISERLRQDVLEHSGKVHLFVADSVSIFRFGDSLADVASDSMISPQQAPCDVGVTVSLLLLRLLRKMPSIFTLQGKREPSLSGPCSPEKRLRPFTNNA